MTTEGNEEHPAATEPADELAELRAVVAKAKAGDASVVPRLREILDGNPAFVGRYGDIARQAEAAWVALAAGPNLLMKESFARAADARRAELTRSGATVIEKLLVERVIACWLQTSYFSAHEADRLGAGDSFRELQFHAKRLEGAQRMFLAAMEALTAFQRLMPIPTVVNPMTQEQPAQTQNQPPVDARLPTREIVSVALMDEDPEPADMQPDQRERLRIGVHN